MKTKQRHYLAFDLGAESGRAFVGSLSDGRLALNEIHRFTNKPLLKNGHSFWDFDRIKEEIKTGIARTLDQFESLQSVAVDTWGVDFGLLDEEGELLEPPVTYRDSRTEGMIDEVYKQIKPAELYRITGNQAAQYNSLFQLLSVKLRRPRLYQRTRSLLFMPDLLNYFLTGIQCSEYTISSTSQFLNPFTRRWNGELLEKLGLSPAIFNGIVFPGARIGRLKAELSGARSIDIIAAGAHDTASAVAAIPAGDSPWAFLSSGTWSLIGCEMEQAQTSEKAMSDGFTNEGGVAGNIRFLQNVTGLWLLEESRRVWRREGRQTGYAEMLADAERAEAFKTIIDPDDGCFFNPDNMVQAIDRYCARTSQPKPRHEGEYTRTILESLALKYRCVLDKLDDHRDESARTLHVVGGGSRNALLNQFTANATGLKVVAGPVEAAVIGNILVQAMADGEIETFPRARAMVRDSFSVTEYYPDDTPAWEKHALKFHELCSG